MLKKSKPYLNFEDSPSWRNYRYSSEWWFISPPSFSTMRASLACYSNCFQREYAGCKNQWYTPNLAGLLFRDFPSWSLPWITRLLHSSTRRFNFYFWSNSSKRPLNSSAALLGPRSRASTCAHRSISCYLCPRTPGHLLMSLTNPHSHSPSLFIFLTIFIETSLSLFLSCRKVSWRTSDLATSLQPGACSHRLSAHSHILDDAITELSPTSHPNQAVIIYFRRHYDHCPTNHLCQVQLSTSSMIDLYPTTRAKYWYPILISILLLTSKITAPPSLTTAISQSACRRPRGSSASRFNSWSTSSSLVSLDRGIYWHHFNVLLLNIRPRTRVFLKNLLFSQSRQYSFDDRVFLG